MPWLVLLLVATSSASECPLFKCGSETSEQCLTVSEEEVILSPCPEGLQCPAFSMYEPTNTLCGEPVKVQREPRSCHGTKEEGDLCIHNYDCSEWLYCGLTRELEHRCLNVLKVGKHCESTRMCRAGAVCNNELCVEYFSTPAGNPAQSKIACESGRIKDGVCQPPSESIKPIPVKCESDQDCRATDDTYSKCVCARNSKGDKYCELHESDEPVKLFLESVHNEFSDSAGHLAMSMVHYPLFVDPEECFQESASEFLELQSMLEWERFCAAAHIAPLLFLLS